MRAKFKATLLASDGGVIKEWTGLYDVQVIAPTHTAVKLTHDEDGNNKTIIVGGTVLIETENGGLISEPT